MKSAKKKKVSTRKRLNSRLKQMNKTKHLAVAVALIVLFSVGIVFGLDKIRENNPVTVQSTEINDSVPENEVDITFNTPWPPTEAQKACYVRLEEERLRGVILETVYCGGTGEYIATDSNGEQYIYKTEQATPVESSPQKDTQCYENVIPHATKEIPADWLYVGETLVTITGYDGVETICIKNGLKDVVYSTPVIDAQKYIGTKIREIPQTPETYSYEEALSDAKYACRGNQPDSTDMTDCIRKKMNEYGF